MAVKINVPHITIENADISQLDDLLALEDICFSSDQLSRRSFRRFLLSKHCVFLVALDNAISPAKVVGYSLIIFHRGTRLARLYSIAVSPDYRGKNISRHLMIQGEAQAQDKGALYYRLEVNTKNNVAISLYQSLGFKEFALIKDYYEDHSDALRMQKRIKHLQRASIQTDIPWFKQSTPFTCGPAALMMAMSALDKTIDVSLEQELQLWREATTIFMTSGHGGCHPLGLALSAKQRGFNTQVWINNESPLFVDGVRQEEKKQVITTVHYHFEKQTREQNIPIHYENITLQRLKQACDEGAIAIVLISTYRFDSKKAPHWVVVSGYDDSCIYLHDPDPNPKYQDKTDCQYMPVAHADFERMTLFGANRMRTALLIAKST